MISKSELTKLLETNNHKFVSTPMTTVIDCSRTVVLQYEQDRLIGFIYGLYTQRLFDVREVQVESDKLIITDISGRYEVLLT